MSAVEIINELPKLTEPERQAVLARLRELVQQDEDSRASAAETEAVTLGRIEEQSTPYHTVDLRSRGISEAQAANLRARLKTFAEDWDRPEAAIYDEDSAR